MILEGKLGPVPGDFSSSGSEFPQQIHSLLFVRYAFIALLAQRPYWGPGCKQNSSALVELIF